MSTLNSKFDILRGWPNSSAVAEDWVVPTIADGDDTLNTGCWVRLNPATPAVMTCVSEARSAKDSALYVTNTVDKATVANAATVMAPFKHQALWGLVIEGQDEYSSAFGHRVTVLLGGGYVVRLYNAVASNAATAGAVNMFDPTSIAPGRAVGLVNGLITDCGGAALGTVANGHLIPLGHCLRVDASAGSAGSTCDIFVG